MTASSPDTHSLLPATTPQERTMDIIATVVSITPWIGSPIANVLTGMSITRKMDRVRSVVVDLAERLQSLESDAAIDYVDSEQFEDLLAETLTRVAREHSSAKRGIYRDFLLGAIESPGEPYDEQLRFLRTLEQLQSDHILILRALMKAPDYGTNVMMGSQLATLERRLPTLSKDRIIDLIGQLNDLRITDMTSLNTLMTGRGAQELHHTITAFGSRFVRYLTDEHLDTRGPGHPID